MRRQLQRTHVQRLEVVAVGTALASTTVLSAALFCSIFLYSIALHSVKARAVLCGARQGSLGDCSMSLGWLVWCSYRRAVTEWSSYTSSPSRRTGYNGVASLSSTSTQRPAQVLRTERVLFLAGLQELIDG